MPGSEEKQTPLIIPTSTGEKPNPTVVGIVAEESIRAKMAREKPRIDISTAETRGIAERAQERHTQHSP